MNAKYVHKFEEIFKKFFGTKYCVAVNNETSENNNTLDHHDFTIEFFRFTP